MQYINVRKFCCIRYVLISAIRYCLPKTNNEIIPKKKKLRLCSQPNFEYYQYTYKYFADVVVKQVRLNNVDDAKDQNAFQSDERHIFISIASL